MPGPAQPEAGPVPGPAQPEAGPVPQPAPKKRQGVRAKCADGRGKRVGGDIAGRSATGASEPALDLEYAGNGFFDIPLRGKRIKPEPGLVPGPAQQ